MMTLQEYVDARGPLEAAPAWRLMMMLAEIGFKGGVNPTGGPELESNVNDPLVQTLMRISLQHMRLVVDEFNPFINADPGVVDRVGVKLQQEVAERHALALAQQASNARVMQQLPAPEAPRLEDIPAFEQTG